MKKSHFMTYGIGMLLMIFSYIMYLNVYLTEPATLYLHSFHLFGMFVILLPMLFEIIFKRDLPLSITISFYVFIFMSQIWGSAYHGYNAFPALDIICHGFSGLLVALFFAYISKPVTERLHWAYQLLYLVGTAVLVGVLWEIIEFCGDLWFGMNNQVFKGPDGLKVGQEALKDTMYDFIADLIGAILGALGVVFIPKLKSKSNQNIVGESA